jgi:ribA/ribD-fused uncharacterized protein
MIGPFTGEYSFLSNFSSSPFYYGSAHYKTVEHFYQAQKTDRADYYSFARIVEAPTPAEAKKLGRIIPMKPGFEEVKRVVMMQGLMFKFCQNPELKEKLISTGSEHLEEVNYWGDKYWGTFDGKGENWLGRLLMMVREILS